MRVWLLIDGEPIPTDDQDVRLHRMGLLAEELAKRGHQVFLWTSSFNHFTKKFRSIGNKDIVMANNYVIKLLGSPGYQNNICLKRIYHNIAVARNFLQSSSKEEIPDIILSALPTIEFAQAATLYAKKHNIPVVIDLRDMWPDIFVDMLPKYLGSLMRLALFWQFKTMHKVCRSATALFGISQGFLQWGLRYAGRDRNELDAIYPLAYATSPVADNMLQEAFGFWEQYGIHKNHKNFIIIYAGSLVRSHRINSVINAMRFLNNNIKLVVAGQGPLLKEYQKQAEGFSNIIFTGWIDKYKISALLQLSSVGIANSAYSERRRDCLLSVSNKVTEYLFAGLPVITNLPETSELGEKLLSNNCGFCYSEQDENSLVNIIEKLRNDSNLLAKFSINAKGLYTKLFVAEVIYGEFCTHLVDIIQYNRRG